LLKEFLHVEKEAVLTLFRRVMFFQIRYDGMGGSYNGVSYCVMG
jgi:hypothetical protein